MGISRTERQFALWARRHCPRVEFVFFDPGTQRFRTIRSEWVDPVLYGQAAVDAWKLPPAARTFSGNKRPAPMFSPTIRRMWRARKLALAGLERLRINARRPGIRAVTERLQELLMSEKYRLQMKQADGSRRTLVPYDLFIGPEVELTKQDIVLHVGAGWSHIDVHALRRLQQAVGFRFVLLCYDIVPLIYPQFYRSHDVRAFQEYFHAAFQFAEHVIFTGRRVAADVNAYCGARGVSLPRTSIIQLGADANLAPAPASALPPGLTAGRYILYVSTIEPRKGHHLLYRVWRRLLDEGIPQRAGFKLLFVGRRGWMVDDLLDDIEQDPALGDTLQVLSEAYDAELETLYRGAAFCVYPSIYEGYGLPIAEAFSHGKTVIASNGGAIPEVVSDLSPCLNPQDEEAWYRQMRAWIENPQARAPYEQAIARRFRHPSWAEAAAHLFAVLQEDAVAEPTIREPRRDAAPR